MNVPPNSPLGRRCLELAGEAVPAAKSDPVATPLPARLVVEFDVAARAASEANQGGTLRGKIARKSALKRAVEAAIPPGLRVPLPVTVTLTRLGGKQLDAGDNLPRALKAPKDVIAAWLGVRDTGRDPRVRWRFRQRAAYVAGVRIRVEHKGG